MDFYFSSNKHEYQFNEIAGMLSVKPYVLRFWETEFPEIGAKHNEDGSKVFTDDSLETIKTIKKLLFEDKMSIPEAKEWFSNNKPQISKVRDVKKEKCDEALKILDASLLKIDNLLKLEI